MRRTNRIATAALAGGLLLGTAGAVSPAFAADSPAPTTAKLVPAKTKGVLQIRCFAGPGGAVKGGPVKGSTVKGGTVKGGAQTGGAEKSKTAVPDVTTTDRTGGKTASSGGKARIVTDRDKPSKPIRKGSCRPCGPVTINQKFKDGRESGRRHVKHVKHGRVACKVARPVHPDAN